MALTVHPYQPGRQTRIEFEIKPRLPEKIMISEKFPNKRIIAPPGSEPE
jgi:hypothetical protein